MVSGYRFEWLTPSVVDLLDYARGEVVECAVEAVGVEPGVKSPVVV